MESTKSRWTSSRWLLVLVVVLVALIGLGAIAWMGQTRNADAGSATESEAGGIGIVFDGQPIDDVQIGTAVAQVRLAAKAKGLDLDERGIAERAVAAVVYSAALRELGRSVGPTVTEQEITDAILNSSVAGSAYDMADVANGSTGGRDPRSIVDDPTYRRAMESILYRNRGLASLIGRDRSTADPDVGASIRAWFAAAIEEHGVNASTQYGIVDADTMVSHILQTN